MSWLGLPTSSRDGSQNQGGRSSVNSGGPLHDESRINRGGDMLEEDGEKQAASSRISRSRSLSASSQLKMLEEAMRAQTKKMDDLELEVWRLRHEKEMEGMRREKDEMQKSIETMREMEQLRREKDDAIFSIAEAMQKEMGQLRKEKDDAMSYIWEAMQKQTQLQKVKDDGFVSALDGMQKANATLLSNLTAASFGLYSATPRFNPYAVNNYQSPQTKPPIINSKCTVTGTVPFVPLYEKCSPSALDYNSFQSITSMITYQNHSFEELRLADYNEGRRYGNGSGGLFGTTVGVGVPDTATGFGPPQIATASNQTSSILAKDNAPSVARHNNDDQTK